MVEDGIFRRSPNFLEGSNTSLQLGRGWRCQLSVSSFKPMVGSMVESNRPVIFCKLYWKLLGLIQSDVLQYGCV